jgi:ribosomal protein L3
MLKSGNTYGNKKSVGFTPYDKSQGFSPTPANNMRFYTTEDFYKKGNHEKTDVELNEVTSEFDENYVEEKQSDTDDKIPLGMKVARTFGYVLISFAGRGYEGKMKQYKFARPESSEANSQLSHKFNRGYPNDIKPYYVEATNTKIDAYIYQQLTDHSLKLIKYQPGLPIDVEIPA